MFSTLIPICDGLTTITSKPIALSCSIRSWSLSDGFFNLKSFRRYRNVQRENPVNMAIRIDEISVTERPKTVMLLATIRESTILYLLFAFISCGFTRMSRRINSSNSMSGSSCFLELFLDDFWVLSFGFDLEFIFKNLKSLKDYWFILGKEFIYHLMSVFNVFQSI